MADIGEKKHWLVPESHDVQIKWNQAKIQERRSQIERWRGQIMVLEGNIMMAEKEIRKLQDEVDAQTPSEGEIVEGDDSTPVVEAEAVGASDAEKDDK